MYNDLGYNQFLAQNTLPVPALTQPDSIDMADYISGSIADYVTGARSYDAVVDISGKGDYTSIQSAIDDNKKRIFVRAADYTINSPITTADNDTLIIGENKEKTRLITGSLSPGDRILEIGHNNVTIANLSFVGSSSLYTGAIRLDSVYDLKISDCNIDDTKIQAIYSTGSNARILIERCKISNCNTSMYLFGVEKGWLINNYFYTADEDNTYGAYIIDTDGLIVANNVFRGGKVGLRLYGSCYYCIVNGNNFSDIDSGGYEVIAIRILGGASWAANEYNIISNNTISVYNGGDYGIGELSGHGDYNLIIGNIVTGAATSGIYTHGANTVVANNIT